MELKVFDQSKRYNEEKQEYWTARDMAKILEYSEYRHFKPVIEKAKESCKNAWQLVSDHFEDVLDMVSIGSGAERQANNIKLSRYACYLIVQNADPSKEIVALGQSYFAIQTRKQEIQDQKLEDTKRIYLREEMKTHNKKLMSTAKEAGVNNYAGFNDAGYLWLYGLRSKQVQKVKWLKDADNLLDHIGSEELAANLFRATQTEAKIKREWVKGQEKADLTHFEVGKKVRKTIQDIWGTMPEKLPASDHIKEAKKRMGQKKNQKLK